MPETILYRRNRHRPVVRKGLASGLIPVLLFLLLFSGLLPGCAPGPAKVAVIFDTGGLEEDDFNKGCLRGAQKAASELGFQLDYVVPRTIEEFESRQRQYAEGGRYALIVCVGSTQAESLVRVAAAFPGQKWAIIDTILDDKPNIAAVSFRDEESSFLAGALAAMVTGTGRTGFIGGMDIPVIHRFLSGFRAGVEYINPDCQVLVDYVGSWSDSAAAKKLAFFQFDRGADIVYGAAGASGLGVIEAAKERGLYVIGVDADQRYLAPENVLVSVLKRTDTAVYSVIRDTVKGSFSLGTHRLGLKENGVGLSLDNSLPAVTGDMKDKINEIRANIESGEIEIPSS
jgi:basic membrane protein A and related proteins